MKANKVSNKLQSEFAAVRLSITWFGTQRSLNDVQISQIADQFDASSGSLSAKKKLLNNRLPEYKAMISIRNRARALWEFMSLPFPQDGIRLIKRSDVVEFDKRMSEIEAELVDAVKKLNEKASAVKAEAKERLGKLFNALDYPSDFSGHFGIEHEFTEQVEPPKYLMQFNPELYERERQRIAARFEEAARLAEEAFISEFAKVVSHITERLQPGKDGDSKIFRDSAVENLQEFFQRFQSLNVGSNPQLDELVAKAKNVVKGVSAQNVRDQVELRNKVASTMSEVSKVLDTMIVDAPRRKLLRKEKPAAAA